MKIPQLIRAEFARLWSTPMAVIAFIALMCVPLLYGGLYLWANKDPYANLDQVPVALVNEEAGVKDGDTVENRGDEVTGNLVDDGSFEWHVVSASSAAAGVENGDFDFAVTIPEDFTEALESSTTDEPRQADVTLTTNDANSYLASTIGEQAVNKIKEQIVRSVNEEAAKTMLDGMAKIRVNLVDASDGAGKLVTGLGEAKRGTHSLASGAKTAASGAGKLARGLSTLQTSTQDLPTQTDRLADGAEQVSAGNAKIAKIGREAATASQQAYGRLDGDKQAILKELKNAGVDQAVINRVSGRLGDLNSSLGDANRTVQQASGQLDTLSSGADSVATGARSLADASPKMVKGIASAASASSQLESGLDTLKSGARKVDRGVGKLGDGAATLHDGLADGVKQIPDSDGDLRAKQAKNIANPVDVATSQVTSAGTYGAGLAPFFVSLAAWIGIYALFLILKPVSKRAMTALRDPVRVAVAGWATPALLGAVQMAALYAILTGSLGLGITHPWPAYGLMVLASVTFASIILALNVWLGSVGQFMGLVLMVVQLVTAGGTFPWQTLPEPLAWLHHVLPMSWAVDGLRQLMYGGDMAGAGEDALRLVLVLVAALLVAILGVSKQMRSRTLRDLRPSLIG